MKYTLEMSNKLNELLERTYDAEKGFKEVAKKVDNEVIKNFFEKSAQQRAEFTRQLKAEINSYGHTPDESGSTAGSLHRAWIDFKALFTSNDEKAMLEEVHRGEQEAIATYDDILQDKSFVLPPYTENLLLRQRDAIRETLDTANLYETVIS